jgi:GT2 family glycosyltransferase
MNTQFGKKTLTGNICVITVTYGERFLFLEQVVHAAFANGVDKIIVVDNGSAPSSRQALLSLERESNGKVIIITMPENLGSASGYKTGMEYTANCSDCEYVWLLDDDNQPTEGGLDEVLFHYEKLSHLASPNRLVLACQRQDWEHHRQLAQGVPVCRAFPRRSSFQWFHLLDLPRRLVNYFSRSEEIAHKDEAVTSPVEIPFAPYGGLFFHKDILSSFGYPDERFFVYGDDTVYTYSLTLGGARLFLIPSRVILDVEKMWRLSAEAKHLFSALLIGSDFRVYYATRNQAYFDKHLWATNPVVYTLNKWAFFAVLIFFATRYGNRKRIALIVRAVRHGESGRLGRMNHLKD